MVLAVAETPAWLLLAVPAVTAFLGFVAGQLVPEFLSRRALARSRYDTAIAAVSKAASTRHGVGVRVPPEYLRATTGAEHASVEAELSKAGVERFVREDAEARGRWPCSTRGPPTCGATGIGRSWMRMRSMMWSTFSSRGGSVRSSGTARVASQGQATLTRGPMALCCPRVCENRLAVVVSIAAPRLEGTWYERVETPGLSRPLSHDDAEAIIEAVAVLNGNSLGEATCGDGEVVEEADAAE